jgi:hypothetical protein
MVNEQFPIQSSGHSHGDLYIYHSTVFTLTAAVRRKTGYLKGHCSFRFLHSFGVPTYLSSSTTTMRHTQNGHNGSLESTSRPSARGIYWAACNGGYRR